MLNDGGAISARSLSQAPDAGTSGAINITAAEALRLNNGSSVTVQTEQADAGDINVNVGKLVHLRNQHRERLV